MRIPGVSNGVQSIRRRRNRSGSMGQGVHIRRRKSDSRRQACGNNYTSIVAQRPQLSGQDDAGCLAAGRFEGGARAPAASAPTTSTGRAAPHLSARGRAGCHCIDVSPWWRDAHAAPRLVAPQTAEIRCSKARQARVARRSRPTCRSPRLPGSVAAMSAVPRATRVDPQGDGMVVLAFVTVTSSRR